MARQKKRLIICCDGTWMNSDKGFEKGRPQPPSNVTRLARSFNRNCSDGSVQVIYYQSGVGTGSTMADAFTGGAFGTGVAENMRESYSFICANYVDGDEIILIGFSRGAFTARSIAGMIGNLGLLTREGMEYFFPIFKDMQNWRTKIYRDPFPGVPFEEKPMGDEAVLEYRRRLLEKGYTRVFEHGGAGKLITVKAVAVFDTVGSLGVPSIPWMKKLGIDHTTSEFRFYDTSLSDRVEYAFHAIALDEPRPPFSPSIWERGVSSKAYTDLRQVWFPGNHGNVGGGWPDQGIANMSMACKSPPPLCSCVMVPSWWMMDQLVEVGVEFDEGSLRRMLADTERYYREHPMAAAVPDGLKEQASKVVPPKYYKWANDEILENNHPFRPWATGAILRAHSPVYTLTGSIVRSPGRYHKLNTYNGKELPEYLEDTCEKIHPSVRIRLAVDGLGYDDKRRWGAEALTDAGWELKKKPDGKWIWQYEGDEDLPRKVLEEAEMGHYELRMLELAGGTPPILDYVENMGIEDLQRRGSRKHSAVRTAAGDSEATAKDR
ncbi:hypothetical protein M406DRAFT_246745 [Cryphonectria parasitica EP155]|uniref:T6SS Phospholipase effector Tle1-like catalytic domain-containing protein n=1 Tax=Cryphonectria parasitica (strain ATCC 38755 / EP155) TaxID=660469 RepID=A0A9P4YB76_CRYP1|nr:uncharacterized protein M406DRAFT_246745 [Cryphonectria parasitica EP155]KAF3769840.1 hypothetical protein M406DRAFT_246745 [Cryphonectria parasitica EP155]